MRRKPIPKLQVRQEQNLTSSLILIRQLWKKPRSTSRMKALKSSKSGSCVSLASRSQSAWSFNLANTFLSAQAVKNPGEIKQPEPISH
jgi:hypothetical protein